MTWLKRELEKHEVDVSVETVRKWFAGEAKPHPKRLTVIAKILQTDEAWLLLGEKQDETPRERRVRNAAADGVVNLVAGLIQLGGGTPAFPEPDDKRAKGVDVFAIIKGAQYSFKVVLGQPGADGVKFAVPTDYDRLFVLGVIPTGGVGYDIVELSADAIEGNGTRKGGHLDLVVQAGKGGYSAGDQQLRQIKDFSARL